ncbi:synaptotagmin-like protein 4 [Erpetoichthys calabaricus]|uniref:Synaptotagmin-like protein 4 n=1 Tax=Erpetoichthys calabaricus TaxID=27687 RepID=A0A8C4SL44_ERPCA|nr:synaptotagmin-like protein 4 [Erpetoichthys calabaricus]XP_028671723.1 synaptotagmin-like protein 4 [Erpetoichthys calabaricus]XP_051791029.1 synaptotagmin-like protein 4 [Erpetoichthys calabaricus]
MSQGHELINLAFLTDQEHDLILGVLRRDEELRKKEEMRIRKLKMELQDIRKKGAKRGSRNYSQKACARCQNALGPFSFGAGQCPVCSHQVCQNCRVTTPKGSWKCTVCMKELDLKKATGDWFFDQQINRFTNASGFDLVRKSLKRKPQPNKRETTTEVQQQQQAQNKQSASSSPRAKHRALKTKNVLFENSEGAEQQKSDTESAESHQSTPVFKRRGSLGDAAVPQSIPVNLNPEAFTMSTTTSKSHQAVKSEDSPSKKRSEEPADDTLFTKNPKTIALSDYARPKSVIDLRSEVPQIEENTMGDRSKSMPGLDRDLDEEEEDIDSLVEIHRKSAVRSNSIHSRASSGTLGSMMSIYSEAGDYGNVEVTGEIVFSMSYDTNAQTLCIFIKECHNLAYADEVKKRCNPYVKAYLLPEKSRQSKKKTVVRSKTVNPVYHDKIVYNISQSQLIMRTLQLSVWHYDRFGRNVFLGEVELSLDTWNFKDTAEECLPLHSKASSQSSAYSHYKGELVISLKYVPQSKLQPQKSKSKKDEGGELHVLIKEARGLTAVKAGETSDSFVKGYLLPDRSKKTKKKSPVIKKTLNPYYDHTFVYTGVSFDELKDLCLELTVWDREAMSSNHFLGGIRLGLGTGMNKGQHVTWMDSKGEEVSLWKKMMQFPDSWAEGTLLLRSTMGLVK